MRSLPLLLCAWITLMILAPCRPASAQIYTLSWKRGGYKGGNERLAGAYSLGRDASGRLFLGEDGRIGIFTPEGKRIGSFGSKGDRPGQFDSRYDTRNIAVSPEGSVYVSDFGHRQVLIFSSAGRLLLTISGIAGGTHRQFDRPEALAVGPTGDLFVAESRHPWRRVLKYDRNGRFLLSFGRSSNYDYLSPKLTKRLAPEQFHGIQDITCDSVGNVYVLDAARIKKFAPTGKFLGTLLDEYGDGDTNPEKITTDRLGNLYVIGGTTGQVRIFSPSGKLLSRFGVPERVTLSQSGIVVDSKGDIFLSQTGNQNHFLKKYRKRTLAP